MRNADIIAWVCFGVGTAVLLAGAGLGILLSLRGPTPKTDKVDEAKTKLDEAKARVTAGVATPEAAAAARPATESIDAAKSALEQIGTTVGSLPEHVRFPGLLVLAGAVLMSVATIQFGGVSLF